MQNILKISVVIPVLNEQEVINSAILHLRQQDGNDVEVIVADGDSNGSTINAIKDSRVKTVIAEKGRGRQNNAGAAVAKGDVLLFLHADTFLPDEAFVKIDQVLKNSDYVGGAFDLGIDSQSSALKLIAACARLRSRFNRIPYGDQAIFIRREYFEKIGRFQEIPLMEDVDLMTRIRKRGDKIVILKDQVLTSPRRWEKEGIFYTTIRNQLLVLLWRMGVSPEKLAGFYKTHVNVKRICEQIQFKCLETLQVNLGNVCNQKCSHCHVNAGPDGKKIMSRMVMEEIIAFLSRHKELTVDITGGCPEMNPDFCYFIEKACEVSQLVMVRTNLTVFLENGFEWLINWYRDHQVTVIGSLPCYTAENVDSQRGSGVFEASIKALRLLNEAGYGVGSGLELDLVYNPGGAFLPPDQQQLETDYKRHLDREYGVTFDNIFTITNAPIGRFRKSLEAQGRLEEYFRLLEENFNPLALHNVMCRTLISVDYRGILYNCDFNQALDLCMKDKHGEPVTIDRLDEILEQQIKIETGKHCFCCTAGVGSSCTGAIVK